MDRANPELTSVVSVLSDCFEAVLFNDSWWGGLIQAAQLEKLLFSKVNIAY